MRIGYNGSYHSPRVEDANGSNVVNSFLRCLFWCLDTWIDCCVPETQTQGLGSVPRVRALHFTPRGNVPQMRASTYAIGQSGQLDRMIKLTHYRISGLRENDRVSETHFACRQLIRLMTRAGFVPLNP